MTRGGCDERVFVRETPGCESQIDEYKTIRCEKLTPLHELGVVRIRDIYYELLPLIICNRNGEFVLTQAGYILLVQENIVIERSSSSRERLRIDYNKMV